MNKNAIFICVFYNEHYIQLLDLLLESLYIFGELSTTDIIIYTTSIFKGQIESLPIFENFKHIIHFQIGNYNNVEEACKARLDLFELEISNNYEKFLYLDTDVIIKLPIETLFKNVLIENKLYALEEGTIDDDWDLWGKSLFGKQVKNYEDKTAFSSGVLLFKNSTRIRELFEIIKQDMIERRHSFLTVDQPYFVYSAKRLHLSDNKVLKNFVTTKVYEVYSPYIIVHFSGGVGEHIHKLNYMSEMLISLKTLQKLV